MAPCFFLLHILSFLRHNEALVKCLPFTAVFWFIHPLPSWPFSPLPTHPPTFLRCCSSNIPSVERWLLNCHTKKHLAVLLVFVWTEGKCKLLISCNKENLLMTSTREKETPVSSCNTKKKGVCSAIKAEFTSVLYRGKGMMNTFNHHKSSNDRAWNGY